MLWAVHSGRACWAGCSCSRASAGTRKPRLVTSELVSRSRVWCLVPRTGLFLSPYCLSSSRAAARGLGNSRHGDRRESALTWWRLLWGGRRGRQAVWATTETGLDRSCHVLLFQVVQELESSPFTWQEYTQNDRYLCGHAWRVESATHIFNIWWSKTNAT